jgi:hypothetical protein
VLLQFDNAGKRCGKTEAEVIEAFIDLLRKLCEGDDYVMWFSAHVAERYVNKTHDFTNAIALYASLRDDLTAKRSLREYRKDRQAPVGSDMAGTFVNQQVRSLSQTDLERSGSA